MFLGGNEYVDYGVNCIMYHAYFNGNALDRTSYGNNGTIVGTPAYVAGGLSFPGGADNYLSCGTNTSITGLTKFELEIWVKTNVSTFGLWTYLIGFSQSPEGHIYWPADLGALEWDISDGVHDAALVVPSTGWTVYENTWYHMVFVVPGFPYATWSTGMEILLNNVSCSYTITNTSPFTPLISLRMGNGYSGSESFQGIFGEVRLYNKVRNADERTLTFNQSRVRYGV